MTEYEHFTHDELACSCCGRRNPDKGRERELMLKVVRMRQELGEALPITSGYRCPDHPIERAKETPGPHSKAAVDIGCSGAKARRVLEAAVRLGFKGIGVRQKGPHKKRIIHLDDLGFRIWTY